MSIDRYEFGDFGKYECDEGEWVEYTDHLTEITKLKAHRDELLDKVIKDHDCQIKSEFKPFCETCQFIERHKKAK